MNDQVVVYGHDETTSTESRVERFKASLGAIEGTYLEILRAAALLIATIMLLWICWLIAVSAYNLSRDADDVQEEEAVVSASDVADIADPLSNLSDPSSNNTSINNNAASKFAVFRDNYFKLYQLSFESFRHQDDKKLSKDQFTDKFLSNFAQDKPSGMENVAASFVNANDFQALLTTMRATAKLPITAERLKKYKETPKKVVTEQVQRTRSETYCSYFSDYFGECLSYDTEAVPYKATVTRVVAPEGVLSHQALFGAYQDNYLAKLNARRNSNGYDAAQEKAKRIEANERGWLGLANAAWMGAAFLAIMFLDRKSVV